MKIIGIVFALLYAGLMIFAVCKEKSKSVSSALIVIGGVLIGVYVLFTVLSRNYIISLIAGMISISAGTFLNGLKQKNIHIHHHIIRLIIETIIIVICWIGG